MNLDLVADHEIVTQHRARDEATQRARTKVSDATELRLSPILARFEEQIGGAQLGKAQAPQHNPP